MTSVTRLYAPLTLLLAAAGCAAPASPPVAAPKCPASPTSTAAVASPAPPPPVERVADELVKRINAGDGKGVVALYGASMAAAFPEEETTPFVSGIISTHGRILSVERVREDRPREGRFTLKAERGDLRLQLYVDDADKVTGLRINPAAEPPIAKNTIPIALPFRGQWSVFWGGDRVEVNSHVGYKSQRRATDLVVVDAGGKRHRGDGKKNEDYFAYGQDVLAVADGTVVTVISGAPENEPGEMNPSVLGGNSVLVKHTDSLYSLYAHLQPKNLRVRAGDKVKQGTVLGACGNSGNSSEPHLHFQLQDGPLFDKSWGVEPEFRDVAVVREGKSSKMAQYTWLKGDLVGDPAKK